MTLRATSLSVIFALASFGCGQTSTSEDIAQPRSDEDAGTGDKSGNSSAGDDDSSEDDSVDDDASDDEGADDDASGTSAPASDDDTTSPAVTPPNITPVAGLPVGTRDGDGGNASGGSAGTGGASNGDGASGAQTIGGSGGQAEPSVGGAGGGIAHGGNGTSPAEPPDCTPLLAPEFEAEPLEIVITNDRDVPIGLSGPSQCQATLMMVHSADNNLLWSGDHCATTCEMIINEIESCTPDCPSPDAVILKPGASTTLSWHGVALDWEVLPSECCSPSASCPQTCGVPKLAEAGPYVATMAILELSEEQFAACESDLSSEQCPDVLTGLGSPNNNSEVPFEITSRSEPVMIDID